MRQKFRCPWSTIIMSHYHLIFLASGTHLMGGLNEPSHLMRPHCVHFLLFGFQFGQTLGGPNSDGIIRGKGIKWCAEKLRTFVPQGSSLSNRAFFSAEFMYNAMKYQHKGMAHIKDLWKRESCVQSNISKSCILYNSSRRLSLQAPCCEQKVPPHRAFFSLNQKNIKM